MEIFSVSDPVFHLYFLYYWIAVMLAYFIPPYVLLRRLKLDSLHLIGIGIPLGIALWAWQGYIFGYLGIRWASYIYIAVFLVIYLRQINKIDIGSALGRTVKLISENKLLLAVFAIGVVAQNTTLWMTGVRRAGEIYFCCGNPSDNIWFLSIARELQRHFPPMQPGMSGVMLSNYHYWSNLVAADLSRVFGLPLVHTQFSYSGVLLSLMLGLSVISISRMLKLGRKYIFWLMFFLYFGGDAVFWLFAILGRGVNFSMSSLEDGSRFLSNLPRTYAIIVFLGGFGLWLQWMKQRSYYVGLLLALLIASLAGFKIYVAVFAAIALFSVAVTELAKGDRRLMGIFFFAGALSLLAYLPANSSAGGLIYTGFWRFENFIVQPSLNLGHLELARVVFAESKNYLRTYLYELLFFGLYVFATFGTKLLALIQTGKSIRQFPVSVHLFLIPAIVINFILGGFFQQKVGTANTYNFHVNVFVFGSFYAALAARYWTTRFSKPVNILITITILALTIPRFMYEIKQNTKNLRNNDGVKIGRNIELILNEIRTKTRPGDMVYVDQKAFELDAGSPTYSIFTDQPMYFSGRDLLDHFQMNINDRKRTSDYLFMPYADDYVTAKLLRISDLNYIMVTTTSAITSTYSAQYTEVVYQNPSAILLRVVPDSINGFLETIGK